MILVRNKEGELCLIGNQSLEWYSDVKPIKVLKELPIQLRRMKCSDKLIDMINKQFDLFDKAKEEYELRKNLLEILQNLQKEESQGEDKK